MKKFLTSMMLMLFAVLTVSAEDIVMFDLTNPEAYGYTKPANSSGTDLAVGDKIVCGDVAITVVANANTPVRFWAGNSGVVDFRAYKNAKLNVSVPEGYNITKMEFAGAAVGVLQFNSGEYADKVWTGSDADVDITFSNTAKINSIYVTYEAASAGWDGTVTTSMDNGVITKLEDLDGLKLTFKDAKSIEILDEEECQYMALQNENGSELYGIWAPTMGSTYTIEGNTITLGGFMTMEGVTAAIPAGTTKLYIEDYGTLAIDGEGQYLETMEFTANIAAAAQPFTFTSVSNNGVAGNAINAVEASENGVMYQFEAKAEGKALSKGTGVPTLSLLEDATVDFGAANIIAYEAETAYIRFMTLQQQYFTMPGTYVLNIPEGTFVDAEGTPNAAVTVKWVIIGGNDPEPFAITGATFGSAEAGSEVEALSYMATITAANAITALHEGNITLTDANNQPVGGNANVFGYEGEGGSTTVYARFNFDSEDHMLHTAGTYTLNIPAGMFADAEGNLSEAYSASWTVKGTAEAGSFAITGATNAGNEPEAEVEALSYSFEITADNAITGLHEGNITLTDANNQPVGGNATVYGYEGEEGATTVYARFAFDTEDHQLHTPGVYTLNVPAGMFKDADGCLSEAYTAKWTIKESENQTINIETVEIGTVTDDTYGTNDVYYTATVKFQKPEGAKYAYSEGLMLQLNGENTGMPFTFGQWGMIELEEGDEVTLVYKDNLIAKTDDPEYEGDLRAAGSYVGTTSITFMNEDQWEIEGVTAQFTGAIVLPELKEVINVPEIANGGFDVEADWTTENVTLNNPMVQKNADGWTVSAGDSWAGIATFQIASEATLNNAAVPALNAKGTKEGGVLGVANSWGSYAAYEQAVTLPAGSYVLSYDAYEANANATAGIEENLIGFFADGGAKYVANEKAYKVNEWTSHEVLFTLAEATTGKISVGYKSKGITSNNTPKLFIDNVVLSAIDPLEVAVAAALASLPVADASIFTPNVEDVEAIKTAINAATTVEDVEFAASRVADLAIPALSGEWTIKNANGELYLGEAKLSAEAISTTFEKAEGGFYINVSGKYVNFVGTGNNKWSMGVSETASTAWNFNLTDGKYTIQGPTGLIGSDAFEADAPTYADKTAAKNGLWIISPVLSHATMVANEWGTFVAPFATTIPENVKAYVVTGVKSTDGATLELTEVISTIPANTPVVLEGTCNENASGVAEEGEPTLGLLTGVYATTAAPVGSYVLQNNNNVIGFYRVVEGAQPNVPANRAYLTVEGANARAFFFDNETAINAIEALTAGKAQIFDLNGRKLNSLQKGINIVNGVKVLVK